MMRKTIYLISAIFAFVLVLGLVAAQSNNSTQPAFNVGQCKSVSDDAKKSCFEASKVAREDCRNALKNNTNMSFFEKWKEKRVCLNNQKSAVKECKKAFKQTRDDCKAQDKLMKEANKANKSLGNESGERNREKARDENRTDNESK